jgi:hypothetical protein
LETRHKFFATESEERCAHLRDGMEASKVGQKMGLKALCVDHEAMEAFNAAQPRRAF